MNLLKEVRPGANRYVSGDGVLKDLPQYLENYNRVVIISGEVSYQKFTEVYGEELPYTRFIYDGSASDEDGERLAREIHHADVVLGIGGGRLLDTAKLAAESLQTDLILIPTLASNCAPYAPVAAVYNHTEHSFKRMGLFTYAATLTFVDYRLMLETPKEYFIAGIGDTLAKWYEIEGIARNLDEDTKTACVRLGIASARETLNILLADATQSLLDLENRQATATFGRVVDTIIALSGTVGGFATVYGRTAGAHAIHNALSQIPEMYSVLHGAKVAYGIFVQLAYTEDWQEIEELLPLYHQLNLPMSLEELGLSNTDEQQLQEVAKGAASPEESFKAIDTQVTQEKVWQAMQDLEKFIQRKNAETLTH